MVIPAPSSFEDRAHSLFCHIVMNLASDYLSIQRRNLVSGIFDYLSVADQTSKFIPIAYSLLGMLFKEPQTPLNEILKRADFSSDCLEAKRGVGKILSNSLDTAAGLFGMICAGASAPLETASGYCGTTRFINLLSQFRTINEEFLGAAESLTDDNSTAYLATLKEDLTRLLNFVGPEKYKMEQGWLDCLKYEAAAQAARPTAS